MDNPSIAAKEAQHRSIELSVPCRICGPCLKLRQRLWTGRARVELLHADRTWFVTLTFKQVHQDRALNMARMYEARNGCDFDALTPQKQFAGRLRFLSPEVTKFLKRVRRDNPHGIRQLVVAEAHESGCPHFHALLHHSKQRLVTKRDIQEQWDPLGFSTCKLVPEDDMKYAHYVCKYLGKSADARVRASLHYGNGNYLLQDRQF